MDDPRGLQKDVSLAAFSTMRLGGLARYAVEVTNRQEVAAAAAWAQAQNLPAIMIGGGSNIFWRDDGFNGLVMVNKILHYEDFAEDEANHYLILGAGETWDSVVERSVQSGLTGIECLSLIPGSVGGTPVQNVGAYGQEIANTLVSVEAYDTQTARLVNIPAADCQFAYRSSRFKTSDHGRFFITGITIHLLVGKPQPPFYSSLQHYLQTNKIPDITPQTVRDAVIAIRSAKLPDPAKVANNGSFFANPVVDRWVFTQISDDYDDVPHWEVDENNVKMSAAWLIEQVGYKNKHDPITGMATWESQSLVLVNEQAKTTADLLTFKQQIVDAVQAKFDITLVQEPELLP